MRIRSALFHDAGSSAHAAPLHSLCPSCSLARFAPLVAAIARARVTSETPIRARVASGAHRERSRAGSRRAPRRGLPTPAVSLSQRHRRPSPWPSRPLARFEPGATRARAAQGSSPRTRTSGARDGQRTAATTFVDATPSAASNPVCLRHIPQSRLPDPETLRALRDCEAWEDLRYRSTKRFNRLQKTERNRSRRGLYEAVVRLFLTPPLWRAGK